MSDKLAYRANHHMLERTMGKASWYKCGDCGKPAHEWSQTHGTVGDKPSDYRARCRPCHKKYDGIMKALASIPNRGRGIRNGHAVLCDESVLEIVDLLRFTALTQRDIAVLYDVCHRAIGDISRGLTWTHVTGGRVR